MTIPGVEYPNRVARTAMLRILDGVAGHTPLSRTGGIASLARLATLYLSNLRVEVVTLHVRPLRGGGSLDILRQDRRIQ